MISSNTNSGVCISTYLRTPLAVRPEVPRFSATLPGPRARLGLQALYPSHSKPSIPTVDARVELIMGWAAKLTHVNSLVAINYQLGEL